MSRKTKNSLRVARLQVWAKKNIILRLFASRRHTRPLPPSAPAIPPAISQVEQLKASPSLRLLAETHAEVTPSSSPNPNPNPKSPDPSPNPNPNPEPGPHPNLVPGPNQARVRASS